MAKKPNDLPQAEQATSSQPATPPAAEPFISTHTPESAEASNTGAPVTDVVTAPAAADDSALAAGATTEPAPNATQQADAADGAAADAAADAGKAARGEEIEPHAWKHPDYSGPIDIAQAEWRNTHLQRK